MRHIFRGLAVRIQPAMITLKQQHVTSVCQLRNVSDKLTWRGNLFSSRGLPKKVCLLQTHIFHCPPWDAVSFELWYSNTGYFLWVFFLCLNTSCSWCSWLQCKHGCKHARLFSPSHARVNLSRLPTAWPRTDKLSPQSRGWVSFLRSCRPRAVMLREFLLYRTTHSKSAQISHWFTLRSQSHSVY